MGILPAEWEPQDAIILAWPDQNTDWQPLLKDIQQTYLSLIQQITRFELVVLLISDEQEFKSLNTQFENNCIPLDKIVPIFASYNDTWLRDSGPITVRENQHLQMIDFRFNGWGNKFEHELDDQICERIFTHPALVKNEHSRSRIILEGGSIDTDGRGTLITTQRCLLNPNRNKSISTEDYEKLFKTLLGINAVHWLTAGEILGDDTDGHIDMLARFCSPDSIAYCSCVDQNDPHFLPLRQMKTELELLENSAGNHYELIELPIPSPILDDDGKRLPASYCNFLIINNAVIVPIYNDPNDNLVCDRLARVFYDREIIPINARTIIKQGGSLHCLTMQLPRGSLVTDR